MKNFTTRSIGWAVSISVMTTFAASGATKHAKTKEVVSTVKATPAGTPPEDIAELTGDEYKRELAAAEKRGRRNIATSETYSDQNLSKSYIELRDRFLKTTTPEDLHNLLVDLNTDAFYNKLAPDAKFAAAQIAPLLAFEGFFNRTIEWMQPTPVTRLASVGALRAIGAGTMVYFPTDQWKAGVAYLTTPSDSMGPIIRNELDFHSFLEKLAPRIKTAYNRIHALNFSDSPVFFDNQVFYKAADFVSDHDRYVRMGEAERHAVLANLAYGLSSIYSLNAYNLNGLFQAADRISKRFGIGSVLYDPNVTTDRTRFDVLRAQNKATDLFELRPNGQLWMTSAYNALLGAVSQSQLVYSEFAESKTSEKTIGNLIDSRGVDPVARLIQSGLFNLKYIVTSKDAQGNVIGKKDATDEERKASDELKRKTPSGAQSMVVSSEGVHVNLRDFYLNAPKSLIDLMPTEFDPSPYTMTKQLKGGKTRNYHNFQSGRAIGWSLTEYQRIFPDVRSNEDITKTARILSQSWGGFLVGLPMASLIL